MDHGKNTMLPSQASFVPRAGNGLSPTNTRRMKFGARGALALAMFLLLWFAATAGADQPIPANILAPKTAREAWNVIRLATQNVERLLEERRTSEILVQISYCSPALVALAGLADGEKARVEVGARTKQALACVNAIALGAKSTNAAAIKEGLANLRTELDGMARHFDSRVVAADIFSCPMHPDIISENALTPCARCGVKLLPRRIPYSFIYAKPGEPTIRLTAGVSSPIEAGRRIEVKIRMAKPDRSPLLLKDLLETHTERVHLLVEEPGLGDYHHEHPVPTTTPGEYAFVFTPRKTAPYRIWADLVPIATGVQEMPFVDLPSSGKPVPITGAESRYTSMAGGYQFELTFGGSDKRLPMAQQTRTMAVTVKDTHGDPVTNLEPVMNAFAHLVGFYSDYQTVVHLHPTGGDILNPNFRGGPSLGFLLFPPKSGFVRLYCQVRIDGKMLFAPFNLNVEPWCAPPGQ